MSFSSITGFQPPTSAGGFMSLLQNASYNGVPFKVVAAAVRKGRKIAPHNYPFRDGVWVEDMGRAPRTYSFSGYIIGDLAPAMQFALDTMLELPGPGILIHPTLGVQRVSLVSGTTAVHVGRQRVIEVAFEFIEQGSRSLIATIIATAVQVVAFADLCAPALGADLGSAAGPPAVIGSAAIGEGVAVTTAFGDRCIGAGNDPAAVVNLAAGLQPPDTNTTYGRYGLGSTSVALPVGTTVASLTETLMTSREKTAQDAEKAIADADMFSSETALVIVNDIGAMVESARSTMTDPADQVRLMLNLATFTYSDSIKGTGIADAMAQVRDAFAAVCRRLALVSLGNACAAYQPRSYQDAQSLIATVTAAFDVEITAAGDALEDETYSVLRDLRTAIVTDLRTRGQTLPQLQAATFRTPLPSLVVAQILYQDATRSDEIVYETMPPHPAFCPVSMQVLAW
jgi:DNA circularisation protein N-terminus